MSISSQMSSMSVSYCGTEVPLSEALDEVFTELQGFMNHLHCYTRELAMGEDRNEEYEVGLKQVLVIEDTINSMGDLFKELKAVVKQIIGVPPKDQKEAMKKIVDAHKARKKQEIENKKLANATGNP
jgi:hypothetical protein